MFRRKMLIALATAGLLVWGLAAITSAQQAPAGGGGGGRAGGGRGGGQMDPARMREMMSQRVKDALGATDEEWTALKPRVEAVQTLQMQLRGGGRGMFGRGGPAGGTAAGAPAAPATPPADETTAQKAARELQTVLDNKDATADQIKAKLAALRAEREKVRQELDKAQQQLREVVTARQEAQLVLSGLLD